MKTLYTTADNLFNTSNADLIRHFYISHNTPCLPSQIFVTFVFLFLRGISAVPREFEDNAYANFGGTNKVYYGRCTNGEYSKTQPQNCTLTRDMWKN